MNHQSLIQAVAIAPPKDLAFMFEDPPLVGNEKREDYDRCFFAVAGAVNPSDKIVWIFVRDITDLSWEIRRERKVKADIIKSAQIEVIKEILQLIAPHGFGNAFAGFDKGEEARRWASDPEARQKIEARLAKNNYNMAIVLAQAFVLAADDIDAVDHRIASYELRRMAVLKLVELRSEKLSRQLDKASTSVLEGEFTDVSEVP
jgi:hypothetical protein